MAASAAPAPTLSSPTAGALPPPPPPPRSSALEPRSSSSTGLPSSTALPQTGLQGLGLVVLDGSSSSSTSKLSSPVDVHGLAAPPPTAGDDPPGARPPPPDARSAVEEGRPGPRPAAAVRSATTTTTTMNAASAACLPPRSSPSSSRSLWRVSVAADEGAAVGPRGRQTKGGAKLCVYVQSATHNFTLLRTIKEIKETSDKLAASRAASVAPLPAFPPAAQALIPGPPALVAIDSTRSSIAEPPARRSSLRRAFSRLREGSRDRSTTLTTLTATTDGLGSGSSTPKPPTATAARGALLSPPRSPLLGPSRTLPGGAGGGSSRTPTIEEEDPLGAAFARPLELPPIPSVSPLLLSSTMVATPGAAVEDDNQVVDQPDSSQPALLSTSTSASSTGLPTEEATDGAFQRRPGPEALEPVSPLASLSTFLTTLANDQAVRESRAWRRFLRVRAEDLASTRVERKVVRTQSAQSLQHAAGLSSSLRGLGRSLRPFRPVVDDTHLASSAIGQQVLTPETDIGLARPDDKQYGAARPQESFENEPSKTPADAALTRALHGGGVNGMTLSGTWTPLQAPIELDSGETQPSELDVPPTLEAPNDGAHSPPFPEDIGRSPSMLESSPRPSVVESAKPPSSPPADSPSTPALLAESDAQAAIPLTKRRRERTTGGRRKVGIDDFELIRVLGKGCAGKVLLVRKKERHGGGGGPLLALKSIVKRHVLAHQELQHTLTEQAVLRRMSRDVKNPFVVHLHYSFHDSENLFLVMDFHPGGDLATQLARWGKFGRDRARFYASEIVEGVQGLHAAGIIYRDLKPENILLNGAGHLVLTDFGLSKEFPRPALSSPPVALTNGDVDGFDLDPEPPIVPQYMQAVQGGLTDQQRLDWAPTGDLLTDQTGTFCGTAEYLAPEVIRGLPYSYGVDWWSFGTLLFEMLVGVTPFWAPNHNEMYSRVLHDELVFPEERTLDNDTRSLLRGLLQVDPALRLGEPRIKKHPYFQMISWEHIYHQRYIPPYTPPIDPENALDTQNFDDAFLEMPPTIEGDAGDEGLAAAPDAANAAAAADMVDRASLWGGYSYRERDAASIFTVGSEQDSSYGRKSGELLRSSMDSSRLFDGQPGIEPGTLLSNEVSSIVTHVMASHKQQSSNGNSLDTVDRPALEASLTSSSSIDDSLQDPPISPVSVHAKIGRTGIAAVDRDRLASSDSEPEAGLVESESDEDDDWDVVEKPRAGLQAENGARAPTLFARGVVDRYRFGQLRRRESKAVLDQPPQSVEPTTGPPTPAQTPPPPTSFSSRRGLTFKGGRFRRKINPDSQSLGELKTAPASLKGSTSNPSSLSQGPWTAPLPPVSPPMPSGFSTPRGAPSPLTPQRELSSRSSSVSPIKASGRATIGMASEDDGPGSGPGSRLSSGEKLKLFGRSGQEKVLNLFKTGN